MCEAEDFAVPPGISRMTTIPHSPITSCRRYVASYDIRISVVGGRARPETAYGVDM